MRRRQSVLPVSPEHPQKTDKGARFVPTYCLSPWLCAPKEITMAGKLANTGRTNTAKMKKTPEEYHMRQQHPSRNLDYNNDPATKNSQAEVYDNKPNTIPAMHLVKAFKIMRKVVKRLCTDTRHGSVRTATRTPRFTHTETCFSVANCSFINHLHLLISVYTRLCPLSALFSYFCIENFCGPLMPTRFLNPPIGTLEVPVTN